MYIQNTLNMLMNLSPEISVDFLQHIRISCLPGDLLRP